MAVFSIQTQHTHCLQHSWHTEYSSWPWADSGIQGPRDFIYAPLSYGMHTKSLSYSHRWLLLLCIHSCHTCHTRHTCGWRKWRLQGPVGTMCRVQEGRSGRDWVCVPDVLRMQELTLVGHDLCRLLTVQHREVGGHVDIYAGIRRQTAWGLGTQNGGRSRARDRSSGGGRGWRAGWSGRARLTWGGPSGGHHGDRLQETSTPGGRFLFGSEATTAAHSNHRSEQDKCDEDRAHDQERHIDGHCKEKRKKKKRKESNLQHCNEKLSLLKSLPLNNSER